MIEIQSPVYLPYYWCSISVVFSQALDNYYFCTVNFGNGLCYACSWIVGFGKANVNLMRKEDVIVYNSLLSGIIADKIPR